MQGLIKGEAPAPDVTGGRATVPDSSNCAHSWMLNAAICNRGASNAATGVPGTFYVGDPRKGGMKVCSTKTTKPLAPGDCEVVRCEWLSPPPGVVDLWFAADDDGTPAMKGSELECKERNNLLHIPGAGCNVIG